MGAIGATIINAGIIISSFGCLVVIINYMAKALYTEHGTASGREK